MTFNEAFETGKPFNRPKYNDGYYRVDGRGKICHYQDLSQRSPEFEMEDFEATDWIVLENWKAFDPSVHKSSSLPIPEGFDDDF